MLVYIFGFWKNVVEHQIVIYSVMLLVAKNWNILNNKTKLVEHWKSTLWCSWLPKARKLIIMSMQYRKTVASPCFKAPGCNALWNFRCLTHLKWRCCIFIVGTRDWLYTRSVLWGFQLTSRKSQYVAPSRFQSTICSTLCKTLTMQKYGQLVCTCHNNIIKAGGLSNASLGLGSFPKGRN